MSKRVNAKKYPWWILGLLLPPVGLIFYFMWKRNKNNDAFNMLKGSIAGLIIYLFLFIVLANGNIKADANIDNWYSDTSNGETVLTVIGTTYCPHCQEYKPVITSLSKKYKFKLYFFEADILTDEEKDKLYHTYELTDFNGDVPYSFVMEYGKITNSTSGFRNRDTTYNFLVESGLIEKN